MVILDEYGRPDRYAMFGGGKLPDGYKQQESGFTSRSHKQVSWEDAQMIVDIYKKRRDERMKQMEPMKTMNSGKKVNLEDKIKK